MKRTNLLFALILVAYALYAVVFIHLTSALLEADPAKPWIPETKRYYVLFDDAMISMRYARNLADGDGLVWNPGGEKVEGYTNPAWVGYMALFHLPNIDPANTSLYIQVTGAVLLLANLFVVRAITRRVTGSDYAALAAVIFTAFYLPLNTWSLQGTEVSVLTLLVSVGAWWGVRLLAEDRFSVGPYLLLGAGTLVRLDAGVPYVMLAAFLFWAQRRNPQHRVQHLVAAPLVLLAFLVPQTAFRLWYYDEWLPNTYYLKMEGLPLVERVLHGADVTLRVFIKLGVFPLLALIFRQDRAVRLLAWLFVGQVLYSIYVGGDAWEWYGGANRYVSIAMPLFFVLLWTTLHALYTWLVDAGPQRANPQMVRYGLAAFALFLLVSFNATYGPGALDEWLLIKPSMDSGGNGAKVEQALAVRWYTHDDATVALAGAGIVPYFAERTYIDLLGKSDAVIAHLPMDRTIIPELKPGHMKWDYSYSIGELQPDMVMELWAEDKTFAQAQPYLADDYYRAWWPMNGTAFYLRHGSPQVQWPHIIPNYEPPVAAPPPGAPDPAPDTPDTRPLD
ncbi:MAG: glycosyltransferase family 39 protein [Chloroflexi bacterium]|nr:glycosyltransferase family 39 protein [Chloroflexota bacterium]